MLITLLGLFGLGGMLLSFLFGAHWGLSSRNDFVSSLIQCSLQVSQENIKLRAALRQSPYRDRGET